VAFFRWYLVIIKASLFLVGSSIFSLVRMGCTLTQFGLDLFIEGRVAIYTAHQQLFFVSSLLVRLFLSLSLFNEASFRSDISFISGYKHKKHLLVSIFFCTILLSSQIWIHFQYYSFFIQLSITQIQYLYWIQMEQVCIKKIWKLTLWIITLDPGLTANGKLHDELTCKTDDGRSKLLF
jgi:hypothetical protein